jgi:hypothetical protein
MSAPRLFIRAHAKGRVEDVLLKFSGKFERPTPDEAARYDRT